MSDKLQEFFGAVGDRPQSNSLSSRGDMAYPAPVQQSQEVSFVGEHFGWAQLKDDGYISVGVSCSEIPSGVYRPVMTNAGIIIQKMRLSTDQLLHLPDTETLNVLAEITTFRDKFPAFKERGLLHKRGVLLWGPPGSGKTCTIQLILDLLVNKHNGMALQVDNPNLAAMALQMIRRVEPDRQIVVIMEDIDALVQRYGESEFLALLDGESQVDNVVYVATTNYPEMLDKRFVDRPSRFDTITWVGMPTKTARRAYLEAKEKAWEQDELDYLVDASEDFSIAHLRELIILTKCLGYDSEAAITRLSNMRVRPPSSDDAPNKKRVGFA